MLARRLTFAATLGVTASTTLAACEPPGPRETVLLCPRVEERCPVIIETSDYWIEPPAKLAADESVVEAVHMGGYATTTRSASSTWVPGPSQEEQEVACIAVRPIAVHRFRVTRVVGGPITSPEFILFKRGLGCDSDAVGFSFGGLPPPPSPPRPKTSYLVVRPAETPEGYERTFGLRPSADGGSLVEFEVSVMRHRSHGSSLPCEPSLPGHAPPPPDCPPEPAP